VNSRKEEIKMALEVMQSKILAVYLEEGLTPEGKPIIKRYGYSDIHKDATSDNLIAAAQTLASLGKGQYTGTRVTVTNELL
jgi:hypothetical protein